MTIGQTLARARRDAGLSVADVSERTLIGTSIVDGIERDDFAVCLGLNAQSQIRAIALAVGLNPGPLVDEYETARLAAPAEAADSVLVDEPTEPIPVVSAAGLAPAKSTGTEATESAAAEAQETEAEETEAAAIGPIPVKPARVRRIRRNWIALAGLALLGFAVAGGYLLAFGAVGPSSGPAPATRQTAPAGPSATHRAASGRHSPPATSRTGQPVHALKPVSIAAFGPGGVGGGDSPQLARLALRGTAATPWHSSWYATAHFGNLQSGTGLILDMGRSVTVTGATIALGYGPGASLELRIGNATTLSRLHRVARVTAAGGVVRLHLKPTQGRYVLVWFTKLPPDHAGTFQASVYEITLLGSR